MNAFEQIKEKIEMKESFVLEAGAGSGKTYTLIQTINYLLETRGNSIKFNGQKIVCITYTNVAKNEILERIENNPLVIVSTIHEFLWDCIKQYNKQLIIEFNKINESYHLQNPEKYAPNLSSRISSVDYNDRAYSDFEEGKVGHDDLIILALRIFENNKLITEILTSKYPYIFIDEYQDTAPETITALLDFLLERNKKNIVIGFYGDSYQKIYDTGIGSLADYVESNQIQLVSKVENYRSSQEVINLLNRIRDNITQVIPNGANVLQGAIKFINCDNYPEKGDLKVKEYEDSLVTQKNINYDSLIEQLEGEGWEFGKNSADKILIIANSRVAERGGFSNLYKIYSRRFGQGANDALLKRDHPLTQVFTGSVDKKTSTERQTGIEHLVLNYKESNFNNIITFFKHNGSKSINLATHNDKNAITETIKELVEIRKNKTVRDVFNFCINNKITVLSKGVISLIGKIETDLYTIADEEKRLRIEKDQVFFGEVMDLPYQEVVRFFGHTQNENVFSTKHGSKGEEYRNVLVIIDDTSWKTNYNFQNYFDDTEKNLNRKLRTKNLFYVSCSRAKEKLVVLSLSKMDENAMKIIKTWFQEDNVIDIN
jgi:DNA helicase-2/ATP-dependent DNA helicase PcrA